MNTLYVSIVVGLFAFFTALTVAVIAWGLWVHHREQKRMKAEAELAALWARFDAECNRLTAAGHGDYAEAVREELHLALWEDEGLR